MYFKLVYPLAAAVLVLALAIPAPAQRRGRTPRAEPQKADARPRETAPGADVSITGSASARELHFEVVPNPRVEFPGNHDRVTIWETERTNLPNSVLPHTTYRDIGIRLTISSVFADIDRIVAEALGEVPLDEAAPSESAPQGEPQRVPDAESAPATPRPRPETAP